MLLSLRRLGWYPPFMQMVGEKQISGMRSYFRYVHDLDSSDVVHLIHILIDICLRLPQCI